MRCGCGRIRMSFSSTMTCSRGRSGVSGMTARTQVRAVSLSRFNTFGRERHSEDFPVAAREEPDYFPAVSTVTEIKQAVSKLPARKKLALARWFQRQVADRFTDQEMMAIAAEGARALDRREEAHAKRKAR